jgi:hypothetical protein
MAHLVDEDDDRQDDEERGDGVEDRQAEERQF